MKKNIGIIFRRNMDLVTRSGIMTVYIFFILLLSVGIFPRRYEIDASPLRKGTIIDENINPILPVLATVTIPPGQEWSFNETVGNPDQYPLVYAYGIYGGGWCDLASRYAELARHLNLERTFVRHSTPLLGVERQDNVSIWNETGLSGQTQDLVIRNTSDLSITFTLTSTEEAYQLTASYSLPYLLQGSRFTTP